MIIQLQCFNYPWYQFKENHNDWEVMEKFFGGYLSQYERQNIELYDYLCNYNEI